MKKLINSKKQKEIGSFFEFPDLENIDYSKSVLSYLEHSSTFYNLYFFGEGRGGIKFVLTVLKNELKNKKVYLPAYLCESVLQPFKELRIRYHFYSISKTLKAKVDFSWKNSLVYIIDYFGTEAISNKNLEKLAEKNFIILDITQNIFDKNRFKLKSKNIFLISSIRKIFPIPTGALVYLNGSLNFKMKHDLFYTNMLKAMILKKFYLSNGSKSKFLKREYLSLYKDYESLKSKMRIEINGIPLISLDILRSLNFDKIYLRRKKNLNYLYAHLEPHEDFSFLIKKEEIKSPFFVPLIFNSYKNRNLYQRKLITHKIYAPVHWLIPKEVCKLFTLEHTFSQRILSLPIDQRYNSQDMNYLIKKLDSIGR